jgi:hypothetical protein
MHKKNMLQAFSIPIGGYPYLGVIVNPKLIEIKDDNPFRKYLHICIAHQNQILKTHKPAIN